MTHSSLLLRETDRREFLRSAAAVTAASIAGPTMGRGAAVGPVQIEEPFCGAILDHHHGKPRDGGLAIRWAADHGYQPVFFHEGLLGGPE